MIVQTEYLAMRILFFSLLLLFAPAFVIAQDNALYDEPPPPDAAFVRIIGSPQVSHGELYGTQIARYLAVSPDYLIIRTRDRSDLSAGQFITVIPTADQTLADFSEPVVDPRKVLVQLVNLTSTGPISLSTADGSLSVISDVAAFSTGYREVNPISVALSVFDETDTKLAEFDIALRRKERPTFVVFEDRVELIHGKVAVGEAE